MQKPPRRCFTRTAPLAKHPPQALIRPTRHVVITRHRRAIKPPCLDALGAREQLQRVATMHRAAAVFVQGQGCGQ
jgi:hypothetical protein